MHDLYLYTLSYPILGNIIVSLPFYNAKTGFFCKGSFIHDIPRRIHCWILNTLLNPEYIVESWIHCWILNTLLNPEYIVESWIHCWILFNNDKTKLTHESMCYHELPTLQCRINTNCYVQWPVVHSVQGRCKTWE